MAQNFTTFTPLEAAPAFTTFTPLEPVAPRLDDEDKKKRDQIRRPVQTAPSIPAVDTMGNLSDFFPQVVDQPSSVLEGRQMPPVAPTEDKMLRPEFIANVESQLNALPLEQRTAALAKLAQRPDVFGRAAKVVQGRYIEADKVQSTTLQNLTDLRLEQQQKRFMDQGMSEEPALNLARQQALRGVSRPDLQQIKRNVQGEIEANQAAEIEAQLKDAGFFERVGAETKANATKAGLGLMNVFADVTGDKQMQQDLANTRGMISAGQAAIPKGSSIFEKSAQGAIASLAVQAPLAVLSVLTGTAAPVLLQAGIQQFGDSYGEARAARLSPAAASARAVSMAAAEVFFERFGFEKALAGLRTHVQKNGFDGISEYVGLAVAKEIPAELATTLTQYGIDIVPGVGLNKNPSLVGLYKELEETLRQTVIQAGTQAGITIGGVKGVQKISGALQNRSGYKRDDSFDGTAEQMAKDRGFLIEPPAILSAGERLDKLLDELDLAKSTSMTDLVKAARAKDAKNKPVLDEQDTNQRIEPTFDDAEFMQQPAPPGVGGELSAQDNIPGIAVEGDIADTPLISDDTPAPPSVTPVTSLYDRIRSPLGPAQENAQNEILPADEATLLKKMIVKTVDDGLARGKTRQQIVDQLVALTKNGITPADFSEINDYMTERGVAEAEPTAVTPVTLPPPTKAADALPDTPVVPPVSLPKLFEPPVGGHAVADFPVVQVPVADLKLSEDVPQFKAGASDKGVVDPLTGKFTQEGVAPIAVWRRLDGTMEVISGRHRLDLAQRSKTKFINAQVYDEAQGFTAADASTLDAELNIRDEQGKVKDYVNYFKNSGTDRETAESKGLLGRVKGKRGFAIANQGSDALIAAINGDQIGDEAAYYIALNAPNDERLQGVGLQSIMDGKSMNTAVNTMQAVKAMAAERDTTTDMFGFDDSLIKEAQEMAKIAAKMQQSIASRLSAITGAAKNPAMAKAEGIDVRDPEAVKLRIDELRAQKAALENWSTSPELVAQIRAARGVEVPQFELKAETPQETVDRESTQDAERRAAEQKTQVDNEVDFFELQPQTQEKSEAPTLDMFADEAGPSAEYQAASELANRASATFGKVQEAYRKQEIGDDDFLAGRKVYDNAMLEFDKALKKEQSRDQSTSVEAIENEAEFIEENAKDKLEAIAQDFMVGDMVRFGSIPGTVVGLEGDYVRMRPDSATSPKAYQRVPKSSLTIVARPDNTSMVSFSKEQDNKFGGEAGQLNANMGNLIQLLGANMYGSALADVTVKELLQNAFDAVKGAVANINSRGEKINSLYKTGKIEILINTSERTITIKDNARGMTPQIVRDAFFTIAGSDKSDLPPGQRSGGLGLAKLGFMMSAENIKLDTVRDGVRVTVDTSSTNISTNNFTILKSPAPKGEHGTSVTVKIPPFYIDPKNGDERTIYFPYSISSIGSLNQPLIGPVEVSVKRDQDDVVVLPIGVNFADKDYTKFKANFDWGTADIFFGIQRKQEKYDTHHKVLSAGVYQFSPTFAQNNEKIPYDIVVNISPNVDARHPDYPFINSRENFKERIQLDIAALETYLGRIALGLEAKDLQESFKGVVSMPRMEAGQDIADISDKLKKTFGKQKVDKPTAALVLPKEISVTGDSVIDTQTKQILVDVKAKEKEKQKDASFVGSDTPKTSDFMLDMKQDPKLPAFHNNTNVDYLAIGRQFGEPEKFFAELGTLVVEMKEALAKSGFYGYEKLAPENLFFAGISIDKKYGGVHIKVPYKAVFINPFYSFGARTLFGMRQRQLNVMIHEIGHTGSMDHGVAHNTQMVKVEEYLADEGLLDYFSDAILDILRRHESTFTAMKEAYDKSSTQNVAKSLEDYEGKSSAASSRGDTGGAGDPSSALSAREGQGGGEGVSGTQEDDSEQDRSGDRETDDDKKLIKKYNRPATPQLDPSPTKTVLVNGAKASKEYLKLSFTDPLGALGTAANAVDRGVMYARNKNIWFGSGLNAADFAKYNGQLKTSQGLATASVALDNAIRGGQIATEVIFQGGIRFDPKSLNFVATKKAKGMRGVYEAEAQLKKRIGDQLGTDIIQGYLEAKRSRSIQNEFYERQANLEELKENFERVRDTGGSEKDIKLARDALVDAQKEFADIELVFSKINMSDTEIDEFISRDEVHPELRKIMENWSAINKNMLNLWRQVGLMSEKRYENLSNIQDYVPWQRIMNDESDIHSSAQTTNRTMTNIGLERVFKKGTPTVITDFKAEEGQQEFKIQPAKVLSVEINGKTVNPSNIKATPEGQVRLNVPIAKGDLVVFTASREIENIIDNMTRNVMRMTMNGLRQYAAQRIVLEHATRDAKGKVMTFPKLDLDKGRFSFIVNGKRVVVEIQDPLIAESVIGMETLGIAMFPVLAAAANITRRTITLSGAFQLKQVFKDAPTAALVTGVKNPLALIGGVYKGLVTSLFGLDPTINILKSAGIGGFQSSARTPEAEVKRRIGVMNRNVFDFIIKGLDHIGDASDMAQRVAVYKRVMAETGNEAQALYQAANVINFLHHGSGQTAQFVVKTVPFAGAYANSTDVLFQALAGGGLRGKKRSQNLVAFTKTATLLSMITLLYCFMVGDDEEYNQLDDQTKLRNFMIPGTKIILPMNTSAAFIFKVIPELIYNKVIKEGTDNAMDARRLRTALKEAAIDLFLGPTPVPSAVKPIIEIALNRDFFTGRPVVPESLAKLDAVERYTAETSEIGKLLSGVTGTNEKRLLDPIEADQIIRGIFGTTGAMVQWISNSIGAAAGERSSPTDKQQPLTGPFLRADVPRRNEDLFYDFKKIVDNKYGTYQRMIDRGDDDKADAYIDKHGDIADFYKEVNKIDTKLKEINAEIRYLGEGKDTGMTAKERRAEIIELQREKQEVTEDIIEMRQEAGL